MSKAHNNNNKIDQQTFSRQKNAAQDIFSQKKKKEFKWIAIKSSKKLIVFSFLQRKCHPFTGHIKKIADQPYYNVIFYLWRTEHKYYTQVCLCLPLIKKRCQMPIFSTSYFEHLLANGKWLKFYSLYDRIRSETIYLLWIWISICGVLCTGCCCCLIRFYWLNYYCYSLLAINQLTTIVTTTIKYKSKYLIKFHSRLNP